MARLAREEQTSREREWNVGTSIFDFDRPPFFHRSALDQLKMEKRTTDLDTLLTVLWGAALLDAGTPNSQPTSPLSFNPGAIPPL